MFNRRWINLCILFILLGVVLGEGNLLVLPIFLLLTILAARWWNKRSLAGMIYRRRVARTRAFPGDTIDVEVQVENNKLLPITWLRVQDVWPLAVPPTDPRALSPSHEQGRGKLTHIFALRWYERVRRHYTLQASQRGMYTLGPTHLRSGDVFGLFQSDRLLEDETSLIVYPRIVSLPELGLPAKEPFGDARSRQRLFEDPSRTMGARDFRPGDTFRHIHWPATARRQELQARVYEHTTTLTVVLCLNVATLLRPWEGIVPDLLERAVIVSASLAAYAVENRYATGLISNGAIPRSDRPIRVMPGRSPDQLTRILEMLAAVTGYVTVPMDRFLQRESPSLSWGATLAIVTPIVTEGLLATIDQLRLAGRRIVLVSLAEKAPPALSGVLIHHLPENTPSAWNQAEHLFPASEPTVMPVPFIHWREVAK